MSKCDLKPPTHTEAYGRESRPSEDNLSASNAECEFESRRDPSTAAPLRKGASSETTKRPILQWHPEVGRCRHHSGVYGESAL